MSPPRLIALSPAQQQVVQHRGVDLQVIACAGSGKTESISRRVAALIAEGAEPASIVAFTFTERAAAELKERIVQRVAEVKGPDFRDRLGPMFVGTIHAYCFRMLQDHVPRFGSYDVLDDNRLAGLLSREYRSLGLGKLGAKHWQPIRDFAKAIDVLGNELISLDQLDGTPLGECTRAYRATLDRFHFLTYAMLISGAVEALLDPAIHARVHGPLRHLIVDEYQDINPAQHKLIELLARAPVQLCVVGDDDQSIYQWRGSDVSHIRDFAVRRGAATVGLDTNRRSRSGIVEAADAFARTIPRRLPKAMKSARAQGEAEVIAWSAEDDVAEAEGLADTIARLHAEGFRYRDIAVLYRSVRTAGQPLLQALAARDIPFSCGGRTGLFLQPEISLFGELFAWLGDGDWKDARYEQARKADLEHVVRGLSDRFHDPAQSPGELPGLRRYLIDWKSFHLRGQRTVSLVDDFYRLLAKLGAARVNLDSPAGSARFGAWARFSEVLADFEHVQRRGHVVDEEGRRAFKSPRDRGKAYFQTLNNYMLHWAQDAYEDFAGEERLTLDAVDILTVHQAKGLEWPVVFLPSMVKGRFPSGLAGRPQQWLLPDAVFPPLVRSRYEGGDDEERRLFYVAMTRARDTLYLSSFQRKNRRFEPSPYMTEVIDAGQLQVLDVDALPLPKVAGPARAVDEPPIEISFSELARVGECGHSYRLGTLLGFQQPLAVELGYGKAIHHVLRQLAETVRAEGRIPSTQELRALVDREFYVPFASTPGFQQMHAAATRLVDRYVNDYAEDLRRVWAVERPFELHFDEGVVTGRADVILDEEGGQAGRLAIVDYKVSSDPEREPTYRLQLQVYAAAGRGEGLDVEAGYLHELRDGLRQPVDVGTDMAQAASTQVRDLLARTRTGIFTADPSEPRCKGCDYRRICAHSAVQA